VTIICWLVHSFIRTMPAFRMLSLRYELLTGFSARSALSSHSFPFKKKVGTLLFCMQCSRDQIRAIFLKKMFSTRDRILCTNTPNTTLSLSLSWKVMLHCMDIVLFVHHGVCLPYFLVFFCSSISPHVSVGVAARVVTNSQRGCFF
jgi:hypothetical protein